MLQQHPQSQQPERREQSPPVELFHVLEFFHGLCRCLVPIDLLVDLLQRIRVGRPIKLTAGFSGYRLECLLIDVHVGHDHVSVACLVPDRNGRLAAHTDADGVDLHAQGPGRFRGGKRRYLSAVVDAVGQKYDYFGFCRRRAQMIYGRGDSRADCCSVVSQTYVDALEILLQPVVVQSERTYEIRSRGERDQTDAVVGTLIDELGDHRLDHRDAVDADITDLEIECLHRTRNVECKNDVDSVRGDGSLTIRALRAGQPDDHEGRRDDRQQPNYSTDPAARAARGVARETDIGIFDGSY